MIPFFRHIRKDLMKKNKTRKSLKYTIEEITLVILVHYCLTINTFK